MNIRYLGHSSFLITSSKGTRMVVDPYAPGFPYQFPDITADIVIVSHEHQDHNASWRLSGSPHIVKRTTDYQMEFDINIPRTGETFAFLGIPSYHDSKLGKERGPNTIWVWHVEGVRFCFLGDIAHILTEQQIKAIGGDTDLLFVPVGGKTTIGPSEAVLIVNQLNPRIVFPMHYLTPKIESRNIAEEPLETFLRKMATVEDTYSMSVDIDLVRLPKETKVMVLKYE
jgi:L-ascorbate metabolism protein UlaG (beta-lactamase superfamily)